MAKRSVLGAAVLAAVVLLLGPLPTAVATAPAPGEDDVADRTAREVAAIEADKAGRTPAQRKLDSQLVYAQREANGRPAVDGAGRTVPPRLWMDTRTEASGSPDALTSARDLRERPTGDGPNAIAPDHDQRDGVGARSRRSGKCTRRCLRTVASRVLRVERRCPSPANARYWRCSFQ